MKHNPDPTRRWRARPLTPNPLFARLLLLALAAATPAAAAVTGIVINRTTGQPQPGATVALNKLGQGGIEMIDQAKSDAQGKFTINQDLQGPIPHLLRTAFDGVTYNHMLPPGSPTANITVDVYSASKQPGGAKVSKHMLLFEPSNGQMLINESYIFTNEGKTAWNDSDNGTLRFYAHGVVDRVQATVTAPGGMPIGAPVTKTSRPDIYAIDYPVKPGETRFDLTYTVPYNSGDPFSGKVVTRDENSYLIAPNGITLTGENLTDLGTEPRTQAHIYGFSGAAYQIQLTGTEAAPPAAPDDSQAESSGPQIEQIMPRLFNQAPLILALALGILALGFALLYRAEPSAPLPKESHDRVRH